MHLATIALLHTNDLHSHLETWPYTAALLRAEREKALQDGVPVLYLDAGDHLDLSEPLCHRTGGQINLDLLADLSCSAFTPGNNETLRLPVQQLCNLAAAAPFPWLGANMRGLNGQPLPGLQDWVKLQAGPVNIGVVGVTAPFPQLVRQMGAEHLTPDEAIADAARAARQAGAHIVILLSHLGLQEDRRIAAANPGVDLIVGGHSHHALHVPEVVNSVVICQAGCYGQYVGSMRLTIDLEAGALVGVAGGLLPVTEGARAGQAARQEHPPAEGVPLSQADAQAQALIDEAARAAEATMAEVLTHLPHPLPHSITGPSALAPLVAESLRHFWQAEIGLVVGGLMQFGLSAGPITIGDVLQSLPSLLLPARLELSGQTLQELLEQSEDPACHEHAVYGGGLRPAGTAVGRIGVAGITYEIDAHAPPGSRVRNLQVQGHPVDPDRLYKAGGVSLLGFAESGYPACEQIRIVERAMPILAREIFIAALRSGVLLP